MTNTPSQKQVLIVGGGFGGVKAALKLSENKNFTVTLLSDQSTFRYYPALYHTATGGLYAQSNIPLDEILNLSRVHVIEGKAQKLNRKAHTITLDDGEEIPYEILILALGAVTNYFDIEGLDEHSFGIKSWEQIQRFKHHLHEQLETTGRPDQNYLIVGAGPTGIELAGALPAYLHKLMHNHNVSGPAPKITIIEAAPRLLPHSPEAVSTAVAKRLAKLGVELRLGQKVEGETPDSLMVNGQPIDSKTVVWTAGTANNPFFTQNEFALTKRGKVVVDEYLRAEEGIYVIGDNADTQYSGLAQTALYDAIFAVKDIECRAAGKNPTAYVPKKPIIVIPVGEGWASVEWGKRIFAGILGWWLREAADWAGFHDLQPWWKASQQWMTEFGSEEDCPTCIDKT
jgi:NADH dehydrogenase